MLVTNRRTFILGVVMAVSFLIVFALMFAPLFGGDNAFQAADRLFNSIAKGSTHYIPELLESTEQFQGTMMSASLRGGSENAAVAVLLDAQGSEVEQSGENLSIKGDLGRMVRSALEDAEAAFYNRGEELTTKYGLPEKQALFAWWRLLRELERSLRNEGRFREAAFVAEALAKGVEVGYNFSGIRPEKASSKAGILAFTLVFYIVYTLWWGYAVFFIAEGLGLQLKAGKKKEV